MLKEVVQIMFFLIKLGEQVLISRQLQQYLPIKSLKRKSIYIKSCRELKIKEIKK